ncbi:MAG TPA: hypothetical protein PKE26_16980 [Kiritimatiellia bacterium]|nr:hypothetical protein [Saprospiraceae bacterium]HMP00793.1 hypothetical protein [Kiritimatiellia bacterium]
MKVIVYAIAIICLLNSAWAERFAGGGTSATRKFNLKQGAYVCEIKHNNSEGHFSVWFQDNYGDRELLANEIGKFNGKVLAVAGKDDSYFFNVNAKGSWSIDISKPSMLLTRRNFSGRGPDVSPLIELDEDTWQFKMTHKGRGNFIVKVWNELGTAYESLAITSGNFDGSKAVTLPKGKYIIEIDADGDWTVIVKPHE